MQDRTGFGKQKRFISVTRRDAVLLLAVLCISGLLFGLGGLFTRSGREVVITVAREEYGRYPLDENRTVEIVSGEHRNVVEIADSRVHMRSANCPDKLCVHQGFVSSDPDTIVCLPHQVVVEVRQHE